MTALPVTGASPVTFVSEDISADQAGTQYQIPLSLITYDSSQTQPVTVAEWPSGITGTDQTLAETIIASLVSLGVLTVVS